jgi:hypothetical protein
MVPRLFQALGSPFGWIRIELQGMLATGEPTENRSVGSGKVAS